MTPHVIVLAAATKNIGLAIWGVVELVVIVSWVAMFAFFLIFLAVMTVTRGRRRSRQARAARAAHRRLSPDLRGPDRRVRAAASGGLDALRRADPDFDEVPVG